MKWSDYTSIDLYQDKQIAIAYNPAIVRAQRGIMTAKDTRYKKGFEEVKGKLSKESCSNNTSIEYSYDGFGREIQAQGGLSVAGGCRCLTKELDMIAC